MKYHQLTRIIRFPIFSRQDLRAFGAKVYGWQLTYWQKQGLIIKLKNGIYVFSDRSSEVTSEEVSRLLYSPSYISIEKALSNYGLIPEMTYSITAVTPGATRRFKNKWGSFIYRHIKPGLFFGYHEVKEKGGKYLMADAEKALLDYIYYNLNKINDKNDIADLRLNLDLIRKELSSKKLRKYLSAFGSRKMVRIIKIIQGEK